MPHKAKKQPIVWTIVLTWNSADFITRCIDSLLSSKYKANILVVDNDSQDNTRDLLASAYPEIEVLNTGDNYGYAGGNNRGIKHILKHSKLKPDYIILLNPDAYLAPDCIEQLVQRMHNDSGLGALSPMIYYPGSDKLWFAGSTINWKTGDTPHTSHGQSPMSESAEYTERINGCVVIIDTKALESVGLMDENYFLYYEETDWSVRFTRSGYRLGVEPAATAWHAASSSTGGELGTIYHYYMCRNKLYFMRKFGNRPILTVLARSVVARIIEDYKLVRAYGWSRPLRVMAAQLHGYRDFFQNHMGRSDD